MKISTPIDVEEGWSLVRKSALLALQDESIFQSTKKQHRYRIQAVDDNSLLIERLDGNKPQKLTRADVELGLRKLNAQGGMAHRQTLHYTVAKETALVFLHPQLDWDNEKDNIITVS